MLEYTFQNSMLLIEALTHPSANEASSPPNQRLALIGAAVVELLLVQAVLERTRFAKHAARIADEVAEGKEQSQTFSVAALKDETLIWPKKPSAEAAGQWLAAGAILKDSDVALEWVNTLCNHVTYAYVCCQISVHKHILHNSSTLQESMREFAKTARRATVNPANLWQTLSACDAPRALSDALLAVAAAVFLDSDWSTVVRIFEPIFKKHVLDFYFIAEMVRADGGPSPALDPVSHLSRMAATEDLDLAIAVQRLPEPASAMAAEPRIHDAVSSAMRLNTSNPLDPGRGRAFEPLALAPAPPTMANGFLNPAAQRPHDRKQQYQAAHTLRDFNFSELWIGGVPVGPPVGAASPHSAARRCARLALGGGDEGQTLEALRAVRAALLSAQSSEDAIDRVRRALTAHGGPRGRQTSRGRSRW